MTEIRALPMRKTTVEEQMMSLDSKFSTTDDGIPIKKLYVCNLPKKITSKDLKKIFSVHGEVRCSYIIKNDRILRFITFTDENDALRVRIAAGKKEIIYQGKALSVLPTTWDMQPDSTIYQKRMLKKIRNKRQKPSNYNPYKPTLNVLDNDCLIKIFSFLPIFDRLRIEQVCKRWQTLNPYAWNNITKLKIPEDQFYLSSLPLEENRGITKILNLCGRFLTSLEIDDSVWIGGRSLIPIARQHCCNLTDLSLRLDMNNCRELARLFSNNKKLERLAIHYQSLNFKVTLEDLPMNSIKEIILDGPATYTLAQSNESGLNVESAWYIQNMPNLHKLELRGFHLKMNTIKLIVDNDAITDLRFPMCTFENCIDHILTLRKLKCLDLYSVNEVNDNFLVKLATNCSTLQSLNISSCRNITDVGKNAISKLESLRILKAENTGMISDSDSNSDYDQEDYSDEFNEDDYEEYYYDIHGDYDFDSDYFNYSDSFS